MKSIRIYHPENLLAQSVVQLTKIAGHHVVNVLRCRIGESLILFDGQGSEYDATLVSLENKRVQVKLGSEMQPQRESSLYTELGQGISRGERMDFVLQKAVELGVSAITPLFTERCTVKLSEEREERRRQHWQAVIISACEQSGRVILPVLNAPRSLHDWLGVVQADVKLVLTPETKTHCNLTAEKKPMRAALLIGPEGGLTATEIESAENTGFTALKLGPRVLRTETAALVALTVVQSYWGDL